MGIYKYISTVILDFADQAEISVINGLFTFICLQTCQNFKMNATHHCYNLTYNILLTYLLPYLYPLNYHGMYI